MSDLQIEALNSVEDVDAVRTLCWEYRNYLRGLSEFDARIVDLVYPEAKYADLMTRVAEEHAPPAGLVRLAHSGAGPVGCGMVHTIAPGTAEIKRVYVRDVARGNGTGRALMQALIEGCREQGFARIVMDTSRPLKAAQKLYLSLGFRKRGPYQEMPPEIEGHLMFFEMDL